MQVATDTFPQPAERHIYHFWDGTKERAVDPMEVHVALMSAKDIDIETEIKRLGTSTPAAPEALVNLSDLAQKAFDVPPFKQNSDGTHSGLTRMERIALLTHFFKFIGAEKKDAPDSPTNSTTTPGLSGAP